MNFSSVTVDNVTHGVRFDIDSFERKTRFRFLKENFGYYCYKLYDAYERTTLKLVRLYSDLNYLHECRRHDVIPKFLRFKVANRELIYTQAYCKCQLVLLKEEIYSKKCKINDLRRVQMNLYEELKNVFPDCVVRKINFIMNAVQWKEEKVKYRRHCKKFNNLMGLYYLQEQQRETQTQLLNEHPRNQFINDNDNNRNDNNNAVGVNGNNNGSESKLVWNLSNRDLTEDEVSALEKGVSFNRHRRVNRTEVISNVEYFFYQSSGIHKEQTDFQKWDEDPDCTSKKEIRILEPRQLSFAADLKGATEKFFNQAQQSYSSNRNRTFNDKYEEQLLINLSKDPSIVITRPDKGKGVVLINRTDYIEKLEEILSDTSKFRLVDKDPTGCRETALTSLLRKIKNEGYLTEQEYRYIKPVGSIPARLYGLPKIHKENKSLRPIVSCVQSYNYRLGKFLAGTMKSIRNSKFSLKNTDEFQKFLKQNSSLSINKMMSFDIESLFTNIPVKRTIDIICYKLYCTDPKLRPYIPEHYFRQMLDYATKWTHFLFNNKYYDQSDGVSMGTPLAAVFAEIFMADFEEKYLPGILNQKDAKLLAWCRYVDDTFTIVKSDANEDEFRALLNTFDPCIRFTVEPEANNTILFLDVLVKRNNKGFDTTVHRKKTATKLMLKWNSLIPTAYKKSSIYPLVNRAIRVCSTYESLHNELLYIRSMAEFNGYPSNFVQNIINKQLNKFYQEKPSENLPQTTQNETNTYKYIQVPYIGKPSYNYSQKLQSIIRQYNPTAQVRVIYTTTNQTRRYFPTKDKLKSNKKAGVVYELSCSDCNKTYIGKTIRQSYRRVNEHEKDAVKALITISKASSILQERKHIKQHINTKKSRIEKKPSSQPLRKSLRLINKPIQSQSHNHSSQSNLPYYKPQSALGKHAFQTAHKFNFENINILDQDQKHYRLLLKESLHIRVKKPQLNATDISVPLYVFPEGIISTKHSRAPSQQH
ncbi:unnamed protein product [Adineta ricciae]|uniref:Reverse transcriptase domain-containing protein n=1 Tax=Adineta ricciae TaxID=249248 RepID=A0A816F0A9_ADIRI|nr:unnamed protein product [Adineta ricciae]